LLSLLSVDVIPDLSLFKRQLVVIILKILSLKSTLKVCGALFDRVVDVPVKNAGPSYTTVKFARFSLKVCRTRTSE
jgi:hypothetical protein